ncbi:MAG: DegT/DnrJ/EryC1/StrS family aminotransferase [Methanogenium sp.]|jgi:dTDP-4-amino-4,6-dideoxygalactose transaminase
MSKLAINGGKSIREEFFPSQFDFRDTAEEYLEPITEILDSNILSAYRGNHTPNFWGGKYVKKLEKEFEKYIDSDVQALAVNSCTSGLYIACGAIGLKPGDEVIVTPWSMTCSATVPLAYGAIPVFCDIEPETYCIDPYKISKLITPRTKAIIVVDLFGFVPNYDLIREIAEIHNLYIIEDAAQALGASRNNINAGAFGDIACFSFTQGKHITCGEGGMIVTRNQRLFEKCSMIRNHAESVCNDMPAELQSLFSDCLGLNFRMTEIQAAIASVQLANFPKTLERRKRITYDLIKKLSTIPCLEFNIPEIGIGSYYVLPFILKDIERDKFLAAVKAELKEEADRLDRGVPIGGGYIKPLYLFPIFQEKKHWAFWNHEYNNLNGGYGFPQIYEEGLCPVCEKLWKEDFCLTLYNGLNLLDKDIEDIYIAFKKVWENIGELV